MIRQVILSSIATVCMMYSVVGETISGVTAIYPNTGAAKASLGAQFSIDDYTVTHMQVSSTSVSYQLYETINSTSPLSSVSWVDDLSVKYRTDSGAYGDVPKGYSRSLSLTSNGLGYRVHISISGNMLENTKTTTRDLVVKVTFGNGFCADLWFVFTQQAGVDKVEVTLDPNGGTTPYPFAKYNYVNGGRNITTEGSPSTGYTIVNTGYKQTTMQAPYGAVTYSQMQQYAASFAMPTTTRLGYVFDAWYTYSSYSEANNVRINEATRPTAKVNRIVAHWLLAAVENLQATQDREDMVRLTWNPAEIDVSYIVYRSETNKKPADYLARPTTTFFEDESAKRGRTYYYWVDVDDGINSPVESEPVIGCRVLEQVSAPQFNFTDGDTFMSSSKKISISCGTSGATVHYTVDGTEPTEDSPVYSKAFSVYATTTVKAIALKEGMRASNVASATITRIVPVSAGEALDVDFMVTTGGTGEWIGYSSVTAKVGGDCLKSGNVGDDESTWIQVVVSGKGTFSFWWKTSCEEDDSGAADWDAAIFTASDADRAEIRRDGIMADWEQITVTFATEGEHTLRWTYKKDESEKDGEDCLYLDGFSWTPATTGPIVWTVTFNKNAVDAQGVAESKEIEDGTAIGTLPTLTRNGYTFDGWWTASDSGVAVTAATVVTADITLYAKWTALPVPTSLAITGATSVMAGGTATYTCMVTRNDGTSGLVSPTWSITSGGAYASINSSGVLNANGIAIPQSVTIQASYSQNGTTKTATKTVTINTRTVTITFNPNGGTVSPTTRSYTAYGTYGSLPSATYTGNSFSGWFTTVNGGTQITESSTVPASATTLYAHWTENPPPTPTYTESTPVPVRHDWLAKYAGILAAAGNDYEAAAMRATGKRDGKGNALCVWHDYVAGTDPTNANSRFTAKVEFDNGMPKVGWVPDLNESGTKSERFYKVFGKKTLAANENWTRIVTESDQKDYNFFKVTVNIEETPDTEEDLKFGDGTGNGSGANGGNERPVSLGTVQDVTASINSVNAVYISWQSVEDATGYEIWRGTELTTNGAVHIATSTETTSYADTQAATGVTYNYFVRAYSQSGLGEFSAPAVGMRLSVPETVTISFNANGGEISTFGGTYTPGNTYGTLPHASRSGYCFAGWWTEANGGTRVFSSSIVASAVTTLYAHWCGNGGVDWTIDADGTLSAVSLNGATVATIPDCVYSISNRVFSGMTKLETINIPSSVTNIGVYTFSMCYKLANINLPNSLIGLGDGAFSHCNSLTSITIPSSLTSIGFDTFYKCTGLENLTIPDSIVNIKERAFQDCTGLKSVIIGKGTKTIQGYVFDGCSSLTDIAIGDNVEEIGAAAFQGCSSLNSIRIPASVQNIGMRLFYSCSSLCSVSFEGALVSYDVYYLYDKTPQELVTYVTSKWTGPKDTWCGRSVIERN